MPAPKLNSKRGGAFALGKEFGWVIIAQVAALVGGLLTIKLLSNTLTQAEFGLYSLLFSIPSLLVSTLFTPVGQINMRFLVIAQEQKRTLQFYANQKHMLFVFFVISLLVLVPCVFFLRVDKLSFSAVYLALALLTLIIGFQTTQQFLLMAFRVRIKASIAQLIGAIARPAAVFLFIWLWGYNALTAIQGLTVGFVALAISQYLFLQSSWKKALATQVDDSVQTRGLDDNRESDIANSGLTLRNYLSYGSFHIVIGLVTAVVLNADRWILSSVGTLEQVAIYASIMQIALAPTAFCFAVLTRMAAPLYFATKEKPKTVQDTHFSYLVLFWLALCAGILLFSSFFHYNIVNLITNETFAQYSYLLPWMLLGLMLERTAQVFEMKGALFLKTHVYTLPRFALIFLIPFFQYLCWKKWGFEYLVAGLIVATFCGLICILFLNFKYMRPSSSR